MESHAIVGHSKCAKGILEYACKCWIVQINFMKQSSLHLPHSIYLLNDLDI